MLCKIFLLISLFFSFATHAQEPSAAITPNKKDQEEASEFIKNIDEKTKLSAEQEAEALLDIIEKRKESDKKKYAKDVGETIANSKKVESTKDYQKYQDWIKKNQTELFAKQAQPLPKIDYDITEKEREKDAIAKLLNNYRFKPDDIKNNQLLHYPLMIFVSSSIPKTALKDLIIQAKHSGGILVFRGLIGSLRNTQEFLGNISKDNVSAIIDPRLFDLFQIKTVPTFVVLSNNMQNCESSACNVSPTHDRIAGNITLEYALEEIANGDGEAKNIAISFLKKIRGGRS